MADRSNYTPEQREAERLRNRLRMRANYRAKTRKERSQEALERKKREAEKAKNDPAWAAKKRTRRKSAIQRYYESRRNDAEFWEKRFEYQRRWRAERRVDEEFEAFMNRIEGGDNGS